MSSKSNTKSSNTMATILQKKMEEYTCTTIYLQLFGNFITYYYYGASSSERIIFLNITLYFQHQQAQLDATFNRVNQIQRVMLGEFTWFNSFLFFGVAVLISYLVTSTPRTSGARLMMFAVLAIDWIIERMIFGATDSSEQVRLVFCNVVSQDIKGQVARFDQRYACVIFIHGSHELVYES